jgi:hypothetical protein
MELLVLSMKDQTAYWIARVERGEVQGREFIRRSKILQGQS